MTDEHKLLREAEKGHHAEHELKLLGGAFTDLKAAYMQAWESTDPRDTAGREKLWIACTILSKVEGQLRSHVANGRVAERQIDEIRKAGEPKKLLGVF
jgi:hypothetical protein